MNPLRTDGFVRFSGYALTALSWLLVACIAAQTFLAGMAVFQDAAAWRAHRMFVHLFEVVPLLMLSFAFAARVRPMLKWGCAALLALIFAQYATANVAAAGALHPVLALAMFWLSVAVARQAGRTLRRERRAAQGTPPAS